MQQVTTLQPTTTQPRRSRAAPVILAAAVAAAVIGLLAAPLPTTPMVMTHYGEQVMGHLARVGLGMFAVFFLAYGALFTTPWLSTSRRLERNQPWHRAFILGLFVYFSGLTAYVLDKVVLPVTAAGAWRGWPDAAFIVVWLAAWLPIAGLAAATVGLWAPSEDRAKLLVLATVVMLHVAMGGMLSPATWGWDAPAMH